MRDPKSRGRVQDNGWHRYLKFLPVAVMLVGLGAAWATMQFQSAASADDIKDNKAAIEKNAKDISDVKETVIRIEERQIRVQEDVQSILRAITDGRLSRDFDE
tara:strand:+ start:3393 stop:3701 length:309 start_codon:yes stop_codon:yes gene_type:complete